MLNMNMWPECRQDALDYLARPKKYRDGGSFENLARQYLKENPSE